MTLQQQVEHIKKLMFGAILRTYDVVNLDTNPETVEKGLSLEEGFEKQWEFIEPRILKIIDKAQEQAKIELLDDLDSLRTISMGENGEAIWREWIPEKRAELSSNKDTKLGGE